MYSYWNQLALGLSLTTLTELNYMQWNQNLWGRGTKKPGNFMIFKINIKRHWHLCIWPCILRFGDARWNHSEAGDPLFWARMEIGAQGNHSYTEREMGERCPQTDGKRQEAPLHKSGKFCARFRSAYWGFDSAIGRTRLAKHKRSSRAWMEGLEDRSRVWTTLTLLRAGNCRAGPYYSREMQGGAGVSYSRDIFTWNPNKLLFKKWKGFLKTCY